MNAFRIALFDPGHRLAGRPGEGLNFSFQGERLGCEAPVLQGVPIGPGSPSTGSMHPADVMPANRRRTALEAAPLSIWLGIATPGA